jgi:hypothetical protein
MYRDVPEGGEAVVDNVYLVAHGISPEGSAQPGQPHVAPPELGPGLADTGPSRPGLPDTGRGGLGLLDPARDRRA